jgi:hypothetical protein
MTQTHEQIRSVLAAYESGLLPAVEHREVEQHLLECDLCFESAYHYSPISDAIRNKRTQKQVVPQKSRRPVVQWLMMAVLAIFLGTGFWIIHKTSALRDELMRGGAQIQLLAPKFGQKISIPAEFLWEEEPEAAFYRIYIFSGPKKIVSGLQVNEPRYLLSSRIEPGEYSWKVESFYSDGSRIRDSITNHFEIGN